MTTFSEYIYNYSNKISNCIFRNADSSDSNLASVFQFEKQSITEFLVMTTCTVWYIIIGVFLLFQDGSALSKFATVDGTGISSAAVGRPSTFTIHLIDAFGQPTLKGGEGSRLAVFTSPPPLGGHVKVELYSVCI